MFNFAFKRKKEFMLRNYIKTTDLSNCSLLLGELCK